MFAKLFILIWLAVVMIKFCEAEEFIGNKPPSVPRSEAKNSKLGTTNKAFSFVSSANENGNKQALTVFSERNKFRKYDQLHKTNGSAVLKRSDTAARNETSRRSKSRRKIKKRLPRRRISVGSAPSQFPGTRDDEKLENKYPEVSGSFHNEGNGMGNENIVPFQRPTKEKNASKAPCVCRWSLQNCGCRCNGSLSYDDFQELSQSFKLCRNFSFSITGGEHYALPPNLFSKIGIVGNIWLNVANATFEYLFDPTPNTSAFKGVSFRESAVIKVSGVKVRRGWNWKPLEYLKGFTGTRADLEIRGCGLRRLSSDFSRIFNGDIEALSISNSRLEMIAGGSFAGFENISRLYLPQNRMQSLRRSDFHPEPRNLAEVDLSENRLETLEDDLFSEMPSLRVVFLRGNPIHMLSDKTFSAIIGHVRLPGISSFPLSCNCELQWMKNSSLQESAMFMINIQGITCKRPPHLRGKPFSNLSKEHLLC